MEICSFDPSGSLLAVAGRRGYVHIVDWKSGGASGQVIGSVKMNSGVKAVWWDRGGSTALGSTGGNTITERPRLVSLGEDAEVYIWDVGERRCVRRWKDDGALGSRVMCGDAAGRYLGIGCVIVSLDHIQVIEISADSSSSREQPHNSNDTASHPELRPDRSLDSCNLSVPGQTPPGCCPGI